MINTQRYPSLFPSWRNQAYLCLRRIPTELCNQVEGAPITPHLGEARIQARLTPPVRILQRRSWRRPHIQAPTPANKLHHVRRSKERGRGPHRYTAVQCYVPEQRLYTRNMGLRPPVPLWEMFRGVPCQRIFHWTPPRRSPMLYQAPHRLCMDTLVRISGGGSAIYARSPVFCFVERSDCGGLR